jgi:hypothetical protein
MRGTPWNGLFYGFVLEVVIGIGALVVAVQSTDFLARALGWAIVVLVAVAAVRIVRRALREGEDPAPPTGRSGLGG